MRSFSSVAAVAAAFAILGDAGAVDADPYICSFSAEGSVGEHWIPEKITWCCEHKNVCMVEMHLAIEEAEDTNPVGRSRRPPPSPVFTRPLYNCRSKELWSHEKSAWCCQNQNFGCGYTTTTEPPAEGTPEEFPSDRTPQEPPTPERQVVNVERVPTEPQQHDLRGEQRPVEESTAVAHTEGHDCSTEEEWSAEKSRWCCEHQSIGCTTTTAAEEGPTRRLRGVAAA